MSEALKKRVKDRLDELGISVAQATRDGDLKRTFIYDLLAGKNVSVRGENLGRLAKGLQLPVGELLATQGSEEPQRVSEQEEWEAEAKARFASEDAEIAAERHDVEGAYSDFHSYRPKLPGGVPEIDVQAGAGEGRIGEMVSIGLEGESYSGHRVVAEWVPAESWVAEIQANRNGMLIFTVVGDSMSPTYIPGDRLFIDVRQNQMRNDANYLISDGESPPQVKRLERVLFDKPTRVNIISDNKSHSVQSAPLSAVKVHGRVVGRLSRE